MQLRVGEDFCPADIQNTGLEFGLREQGAR